MIEIPVHYRIDLTAIEGHLLHVTVDFDVTGMQELEVSLPAWTPGSYLIREYARQIETIELVDSPSASIIKTAKDQWQIRWHDALDSIRVKYQIYAREKSVRTNWVEPEFCFIAGAATFLSSEVFRDSIHAVSIEGLADNFEVVCSLKALDRMTYHAASYDELVDSPLLIGNLVVDEFIADKRPHRLVSTADATGWDHSGAARDVQQIVETVQRFWGDTPYDRYDFQNLIVGGFGGLEHDNCTVLMTERWTMHDRKSYVEWLGLVCHEFFHTWNVRRLRPATLLRYDYRREQYFPELWIAEGITSYFDDLLVLRAGMCSESEYLERLSKPIQTVMNAPGRLIQSLADSSFDTWIKFYRPDENADNSRVSYYQKGALVAWMLDVRLQVSTDGRVDLGDVMRTLWQRHRLTGYSCRDFESIVAEKTGCDWHEWFDQHIRSTCELDFTQTLAHLGLQFADQPDNAISPATSLARQVPSDDEKIPSGKPAGISVGFETRLEAGRLTVSKVYRGGAASVAGLQVGDELVAADGQRVDNTNWEATLLRYAPGQSLVLTYFRRSQLSTLTIISERRRPTWRLEIIGDADALGRHRWLYGHEHIHLHLP